MLATFLRDVSVDIAVADLLLTSLIAQNPQFVFVAVFLALLTFSLRPLSLGFPQCPGEAFQCCGTVAR
jgi:hypothetical protein